MSPQTRLQARIISVKILSSPIYPDLCQVDEDSSTLPGYSSQDDWDKVDPIPSAVLAQRRFWVKTESWACASQRQNTCLARMRLWLD